MVRRRWVNFQCQGVLFIWIKVGQVPNALAVGGGGLDIFLWSVFFLFFLPLWGTALYRLKYYLKGHFNPKSTIQTTWKTRIRGEPEVVTAVTIEILFNLQIPAYQICRCVLKFVDLPISLRPCVFAYGQLRPCCLFMFMVYEQ